MKKQEGYPLVANAAKVRFVFDSIGPKGAIPKIIEFSRVPKGRWNLGFGDVVEGGDWSDSVTTDNDDMRTVLQTVANAAHQFSEKYPRRTIQIQPSDERRKLLYNRIFRMKFDEVNAVFEVRATSLNRRGKESKLELFDASKLYDVFVLTRRNHTFDQ